MTDALVDDSAPAVCSRSARHVLAALSLLLAVSAPLAHVDGPAAQAGVDSRSRLLTEGRMPAFRLQDPAGRWLTQSDFLGRWAIVFLGYTSCPDACPTTMTMLTQAFGELGGDADRVRALFVAIDPRRDRPEVLAAYLANFSPRITAGTGSMAQVETAARAFGMRFEIQGDPNSRTYTVDHSVTMLLFAPDGRFVSLVPGGTTAAELTAVLRKRFQTAVGGR